MLGLLASTALMFAVGAWRARRRPRAGAGMGPLPLSVALGQLRSAKALSATMGAFVLSFAALAALAVGAHQAVGAAGPLWVAFGLPWVVPVMVRAGRWGQVSGADGRLLLDAHSVTLHWGAHRRRLSRSEAQVVEHVVRDPTGGAGAWALTLTGPEGGFAVVWPSQGFLAERFCAERAAAGAQLAPRPPVGAAPLIADLFEVRALVAHLSALERP